MIHGFLLRPNAAIAVAGSATLFDLLPTLRVRQPLGADARCGRGLRDSARTLSFLALHENMVLERHVRPYVSVRNLAPNSSSCLWDRIRLQSSLTCCSDTNGPFGSDAR